MSKHVLLATLAAAVAVAGCTANANMSASVGASASPSAAPSAAASGTPTVSASAAVTVGASTAPAGSTAAGVDAAAAAMYKLGRKWVYDSTSEIMGKKTTTPFTWEVTKVEGAKATVTQTMTVMDKTQTSTFDVDLSKKPDATTWVTKTGTSEATWKQTSSGAESITVKAGEFATTKLVGTLTYSGGSGGAQASGSSETTSWVSDEVGLVKSVSTGGQVTETMGIKVDGRYTNTLELVSVTK